jgi:uncharacterized protein (TIGR02246 family)
MFLVAVAASPESEVRSALQRYARLVQRMDHSAIAAMFAPDGQIVNPGRDPIKGRPAIEAFLRQFGAYHVISEVLVPRTTSVDGAHATQAGTYRQRVRGPDGSTLDVSGDFIIEWTRDPSDAWMIQRTSTTPKS